MKGPRDKKARRSSEEARERLLAAGWESEVRAGLILWRKPGGQGHWYSESVALDILEYLGGEKGFGEDMK